MFRRILNHFPRLRTALHALRGVPLTTFPRGKHAAWLEYPVSCKPRWGHGLPPHARLTEILGRGRNRYAETLRGFLPFADSVASIPRDRDPALPAEPNWVNGWLPDLDGLAIYCFLAQRERGWYVEVGSGNSTRFARRAVKWHGWNTRLVSIDPCPRAEIDDLCDEVIRSPLEVVDPTLFDRLGDGDVLFIDNSHYSFMGSDVTVFFFDILPRLRPGVLVGVHDIFLPDDYPLLWEGKYYNEQYLLGCWLLGGGGGAEIVLPARYVSNDAGLAGVVAPMYRRGGLAGITPDGNALWFRIMKSAEG
jgi:hypothetical protein